MIIHLLEEALQFCLKISNNVTVGAGSVLINDFPDNVTAFGNPSKKYKNLIQLNNNIMVSVCMITYNQEKFIRDAIEGVLMQDVAFDIEVIIADDNSSDNTEKIILDIATKHTNGSWIRYTKHKTNKGMMPNFIWALQQCKGKYIALCEGDDYWTDSYKLQKQVDFLENNLTYSGVFGKVKALVDGGLIDDTEIENRYNKIDNKEKIEITHLLEHSNFIHTCTFFFRKEALKISPFWNLSPVGDIMLFANIIRNGYVKRLDYYIAVYRRNTGVYSSLSYDVMLKKQIQYRICMLAECSKTNEKIILINQLNQKIDELELIIKKRSKIKYYNFKSKNQFLKYLFKSFSILKSRIYKLIGRITFQYL